MADSRQDDLIRAAGAVVWRPGLAGQEIALVHRPRYDDWSFPKGKRQPDEHVLVAAIREIMEETGLHVVLGRRLTSSVYQTSAGIKQVSYWEARCVGSAGFVPSHEVDQMQWLPAAQARERLSYDRDVALLDEFSSGQVSAVPLVLLRHAPAGSKSAWRADRAARSRSAWSADQAAADLARPLDARGSADANFLAWLLASYGTCQVISSPAERCVATVRPYAAAVGVPVQVEPGFLVAPEPIRDADLLTAGARTWRPVAGSPPESPAEQGTQIAAKLATSGIPTLICAHRENLPRLIEAAFGALGAKPPAGDPLGKAEFWVLQAAGSLLASAERHGLAE